MLLAAAPVIHSIYDELRNAFGSDRLYHLLATTLADDFVYTDPAVVLLGRDAMIEAAKQLSTIQAIDRLTLTAREMGGHVVATGVCVLRHEGHERSVTHAFSALWRHAGEQWLCVAHRGTTALLSAGPVGR
jgi:hypothetical protein